MSLKSVGTVYVSPVRDSGMAAERLSIIRQLVNLGYRVVVPDRADTRLNPDYSMARFLKEAGKAGARVWHVSDKRLRKALSHDWFRDRMLHVASKTIIGGTETEALEPPKNPSLEYRGKRIFSPHLADGRQVMELFPNFFIVSSSLFNTTFIGRQIRELEAREKVRFVPVNALNRDDIDMHINSVPAAGIVVADRDFMRQNTRLAHELKSTGRKIVYVKPSEARHYFPNFLKLSHDTILATKDAPKTSAALRSMGINVIASESGVTRNLRQQGGIRCFTQKSNSLYRKVYGHARK